MARLQRLLFETEREFLRTATTLIYRVGEPELKYLLCQHVWESAGHARFLRERGTEGWVKVDDILDVWFDSGSTHAFVLDVRPELKTNRVPGGPDRVMYLEGSDQHRGWFHSSLLESCGPRGRPPYDAVLTHGFVLDEDGRKMSKSLGNVVAPQTVIKDSGADILRLWVCASDYSDDLRIGPEILKST
eukprot:gene13918-17004_t